MSTIENFRELIPFDSCEHFRVTTLLSGPRYNACIEGNIFYILGNWANPIFWAGAEGECCHHPLLDEI